MKIINGGEVVLELPDKPKDFITGTWQDGKILIETRDGFQPVGKCDRDQAVSLINKIYKAYVGGQQTFSMPDE